MKGARTRAAALAAVLSSWATLACGESRHPIGEECLRDDDCLSGVCAARTCVSTPSLVSGATEPPGEEEPRIPDEVPDASGALDA